MKKINPHSWNTIGPQIDLLKRDRDALAEALAAALASHEARTRTSAEASPEWVKAARKLLGVPTQPAPGEPCTQAGCRQTDGRGCAYRACPRSDER